MDNCAGNVHVSTWQPLLFVV